MGLRVFFCDDIDCGVFCVTEPQIIVLSIDFMAKIIEMIMS